MLLINYDVIMSKIMHSLHRPRWLSLIVGQDCSIPLNKTSWITVPTDADLPMGRASFAADVLDDFLYVHGGETLRQRHLPNFANQSQFYR